MKMGVWPVELLAAGFRGPVQRLGHQTSYWFILIISGIEAADQPGGKPPSHERGMASAPHFDEVLVTFNTDPTIRKGDVMTKSINRSSTLLALALLVAGASQAMAGSGPSTQEKMACRADAESFCSQFIGKPPQMRACLAQNKAKLSVPCREVVEAHGG